MHETGAIQAMIEVLRQVQAEQSGRSLARIVVELSAFGGWDETHFREHFCEGVRGTSFENAVLEIEHVKTGPEIRLVRATFAM
jgi:Zn finger protein HypA/HybF involved in hydrogenase expression